MTRAHVSLEGKANPGAMAHMEQLLPELRSTSGTASSSS